MFEDVLRACERLARTRTPAGEIGEDILQTIPDTATAQDLNDFLSAEREDSDIIVLWAAYAIATKISKDGRSKDDDNKDDSRDLFNEISDRISSIILPISSDASLDEDKTDYTTLQRKGELGLLSIEQLVGFSHKTSVKLPSSTLLCLTAFTNAEYPWTTAKSSTLASSLLDAQARAHGESHIRSFITEDILSKFLRPLFSKSRSAAVTASGRKAEFVETSRYDNIDRENPETKPWKYTHRYAVTVFAWAVRHADTTLLQSSWPLFTPVLLTLLDESQHTGLKVQALNILRGFWERCPAGLMRNTGLAEVFEQAVFPAVLYLPSLTPEDESLQILSAAYPVLIEMAGIKYPYAEGEQQHQPPPQFTEPQRKLLDKIIREGIMVGYHHAKDHIKIVGLLCEILTCIINGMGILAVKHLKDIMPMTKEIMIDPFGTKYPPALISATKLLQAILRACWPRIGRYCNELVMTLTLCWANIREEESLAVDSPIAKDLKTELTKAASILTAIMNAEKVDLNERVSPLVEQEEQLQELFKSLNVAHPHPPSSIQV
ncbi:hypothetical protein M426DRAFT_123417 [Hypoxylon sp. CI-4A]|nr:hypothetical protein M426DRAFT_123417 [Hypoxylon sp. CI-4A]